MKKNATFLILAALFVANFFLWDFLFSLREGRMSVIFFDVGQGDAIFIKTPQNHYILIDGGPGDKVLEGLGREMPFFHNYIDLVILTHPHDDHVSGLIEVLSRYEVGEIICTGVLSESSVGKKWKKIIEESGYRVARAGQRISANDFYIDILYPVKNIKNKEVNDLNEVSVISKFVFNDKYRFLFTGDAYKKQEREIVSYKEECLSKEELDCSRFSLDVDILKIGHHGSRTSTSREFLHATSPSIAVIMAGEDNRYGHPHNEVVEKLNEYEIEIMRTDKDGDIFFNFSEN